MPARPVLRPGRIEAIAGAANRRDALGVQFAPEPHDAGIDRPVERIGGIVGRRGKTHRELVVLENATVDLKAALVMYRSGGEEQLSPGQVALLRLFLANPRKVLTRDDIMAAAPAESSDSAIHCSSASRTS